MRFFNTSAEPQEGSRHLSAASWKFAILSVVAPSFLYIVLMIYFCPPRLFFIAVLSAVVFLGLFINRFVFLFLLASAMIFDVLILVSTYFQMPLGMVFDATRYVGALSVQSSFVYAASVLVFLGSLYATYTVTQQAKKQRQALSLLPFVFVTVGYLALDGWANTPVHEVLGLKNSNKEPFTPIEATARKSADFASGLASEDKSNLLVVMVEGLGAFENQSHQDLIWGPLLAPEVEESFATSVGIAAYFGSTSSAEVRELCNRFGDYRHLRDVDTLDCLPKRAQSEGYQTAAFHAFTGSFFERFDWYPKIGFEKLYFLENNAGLAKEQATARCGLTFEGLCDADVALSVKSFLLTDDAKPKFAYWLTLNSHKPVAPGEVPERLNCEDGGVFEDQELCRMGEQWLNVSYLVHEMAMDPAFENTEILLVGDHHPPLFTRHGRAQFQPGQVAWLHLKPQNDVVGEMAEASPGNHLSLR